MDIEEMKAIFTLISGEEVGEGFTDLINLAISETLAMLRPEANKNDFRLNYLVAAIANYRLQQMYSARERAAVTYAGKIPKEYRNTACEYARALVRDYMKICGKLLKVSDFVFSSFSESGEEI